VATQTGVDPQFGTSAVSATAAQQRQIREAEDARKFGKEAKRRLICIEKGGDSVIISHCVEGAALKTPLNSSTAGSRYRRGGRLTLDLLG